jgi:hypothetical protein
MGQDHHDRYSSPPASPQAAIATARAQLLGGRGPGASPQEITAHTRARPRLGDSSIPQRREQVAANTAVARGDPDGHCQVDGAGVFGRCVTVWTSMGAWMPRRRCTEVTGSRWRSLATVCGCISGSR